MDIFKRESPDQPPTWQVVVLITAGLFFNTHSIVAASIGMGYEGDPVVIRLGIAAATAFATSALLTAFGYFALLRKCPKRITWFTFAALFLTGTFFGFLTIR